jgi:hypothetical protein
MSSFGNPLNVNLSQPNLFFKNPIHLFCYDFDLEYHIECQLFIAKASPWIAF